MRHSRHPQRRGFTLVELLVACALTVLIMAVLATAFSTGMTTFSHLKSTVGLSEQLRSAETILRRDLEAVHLEDADGLAVRVSKAGTDTKGYFEIVHGSTAVRTLPTSNKPFIVEGIEDLVESYRATDHGLFFTSKLTGASEQETFTGAVADPFVPIPLTSLQTGFDEEPRQTLSDFATAVNPSFVAKWAEMGLFLVPSNVSTTEDGATGGTTLPLYSLIRRQRVLAATAVPVTFSTPKFTTPVGRRDYFPEASFSTQTLQTTGASPVQYVQLNDPTTVRIKANRLGYLVTGFGPGATLQAVMPDGGSLPSTVPRFSSIQCKSASNKDGTDVLVTNVVSMHIRVMDSTGTFKDTMIPMPAVPASSPYPPFLALPGVAPAASFPNSATEGYRLDTATPGVPQMRAVQIKLRVYDTKNHLTRQMTMTFDL
jgi:type II secretory pathway pseudopilin PulG